MKQGNPGRAYKEYNELKASQPFVDNQDFEPFIVDNIFDESDYELIYKIINETPMSQTRLKRWAGHRAYDVGFPKKIEDKINAAIDRFDQLKDVHLVRDYSFARYSPSYGYETKLFPHCDYRASQRITFDIQLKADEPWGVVVEDKTYWLQDNQALVFAGTQQAHWREQKKVHPESNIDMIFCHLEYKNPKPLQEGQDSILQERTIWLSTYYKLEPIEQSYYEDYPEQDDSHLQ